MSLTAVVNTIITDATHITKFCRRLYERSRLSCAITMRSKKYKQKKMPKVLSASASHRDSIRTIDEGLKEQR